MESMAMWLQEHCVLLGPSGSGKTTLLHILSNTLIHQNHSILCGSIFVNGINAAQLGRHTFRNLVGVVQQHNVLFDQQTVYETLMTAAKLNGQIKGQAQRETLVQNILDELDLVHVRDTRIGDEKNRGISGGEHKRVVIGIELINNPSLLFLDEPTSGLDSFQSLKVVQALKKLCDNGLTVILSIHQARSSIFGLFDTLLLLTQNGYTAYHGPSRDTALQYFKDKNYTCPTYYNPVDFLLDIISIDSCSQTSKQKGMEKINALVKAFKDDYKPIEFDENSYTQEDFNRIKVTVLHKTKTSRQFCILIGRSCRQLGRNRRSFITRLIATLVPAFLVAALYSQLNGSIWNRQNLFGFIALSQLLSSTVQTVPRFWTEKCIIMREIQKESYSIELYYLVTMISTMPFLLIFP
eukprot:1164850_1